MATPPHRALAPTPVNQLIEEHLPLVGHLVRETLGKVPAHVHRDDLSSAAMTALVLAAQGFDPDRGVPFARYAAIRIRGALLDELRGMDWAARSVRTRAREIEAVRTQLTAALRRTPRPDEIAAALGISRTELAHAEHDTARANTLSLHGFAPDTGPAIIADQQPGPETLLLLREQLGYLHDAVEHLPERLRYVITAYFFQQRHMADIGNDLGVSESRVSQLRAEALTMLRDGLNTHLDPHPTPTNTATSTRSKRATATHHAYTQAIGTSTLHTRLAKTNHHAETLPHHHPQTRTA